MKYSKISATKFSGKLPHLNIESEMHGGKQQAKQTIECRSEQIQIGDGFGQCMNNEQRCAGQGEKTDRGNARGGAFEERYRLGAKTRKTFIQSTNEMCVRQDEGE